MKRTRVYLRASDITTAAGAIVAAMVGVIILLAGLACTGSASAMDWHVNGGESIQVAIDNATDGDTIIVHEGIYEEQLYIAKSIDLKAGGGENPEIWAPEPEELESYVCNFSLVP